MLVACVASTIVVGVVQADAVAPTAHASPRQVHLEARSKEQLIPASTATANATDKVIVAYYADWTANRLPASAIPYGKMTHLNYAFALPKPDGQLELQTPELLDTVVKGAHAVGTKVLLSVGGWTGSRYLSPISASKELRATFVQTLVRVVQTHTLDGIDLDWEYPGRPGMACNIVDGANDSTNYLLLLQELRAALTTDKEITLAVRVQPFDGPGGPLASVADYVPSITRINIMAYDINGSWSPTTGPNAPLAGTLSVQSSVEAWTKAAFPASKIAIGVPFYGRSLTTTSDMSATAPSVPHTATTPKGDPEDAPWAEPCPGAPQVFGGIWQWRLLRASGGPLSSAIDTAGEGWERHWDDTSSTPWLYRASDHIFISYDDPKSLGLKVDWVKAQGLAGLMAWDLHQDNGELLDVLQGIHH